MLGDGKSRPVLIDVPPNSCPSNVLLFLITFFAVLRKADDVFNLVNKAYQLDTYRGVYEDERFDVRLPVPGELTRDTAMLPPRLVDVKSGRGPNE